MDSRMNINSNLRILKKIAVFILLSLILCAVSQQLAGAPTAPASVTREIKILADGTVEDSDPVTPLIQAGDIYTFSGDIYGRIDVEKNDITIDGAGYSLIQSGGKDFALMIGGIAGLELPRISGVTVKNMRIVGFHYAISLHGRSDVVSNVTVTGGTDYNGVGIWVDGSSHTVQGCKIVGNKGMGILVDANYTAISDTIIADNGNFGIYFYDTAGKLRNNTFNNNTAGPFHMDENQMRHAGQPFRITSNDIDPSNTVDGKPVYYWVNEHDKSLPSEAGYVVLDNCTNIIINGLSIYRNPTTYPAYQTFAINLIRSSNIIVRENRLENTGIWCSYSSQNIILTYNTLIGGSINTHASNTSILMNTIAFPNGTAISLGGQQAKATVAKNILSGCGVGISLQSCDLSRIIQNNISNCNIGIDIFSSNNNTFTKNNFLNNTQQVSEQHSALIWPLTQYYQSLNNNWNGNYWSTYNGIDANGDGIGDTPYVIFENITDYQPLISPFDITAPIPEIPQGTAPPMPTPTPLATVSPTASPTPTTVIDQTTEIPPTALYILAGIVGIMLAAAGLIIYRKKSKNSSANCL
jgi:parallel beta-helix repeat protein